MRENNSVYMIMRVIPRLSTIIDIDTPPTLNIHALRQIIDSSILNLGIKNEFFISQEFRRKFVIIF